MKPIIFSTAMVQAILAGRKTETRRVIKPQPPEELQFGYGFITSSSERKDEGKYCWTVGEICDGRTHNVKPRYKPGDILYVREIWNGIQFGNGKTAPSHTEYWYKADEPLDADNGVLRERWKPSIHMPREAARLFLRVTDVRVERLLEITEEGAKAEGISEKELHYIAYSCNPDFNGPIDKPIEIEQFKVLWDSLNAKRGYGWEVNPWVWVIKFEVMPNDR